MTKSINRCYFDKLTFEALYNAYKRASLCKRKKKEVILFELNLETNLIKIYNELRFLTYKPIVLLLFMNQKKELLVLYHFMIG